MKREGTADVDGTGHSARWYLKKSWTKLVQEKMIQSKLEDITMRLESKEIAAQLIEITFGEKI